MRQNNYPSPDARTAKQRLRESIVAVYSLQGLNYIVPIALLPYLVRVLGFDNYGLLAFAQAFAQYFTILIDYGFNFSATRSVARFRTDRDAISNLFCAVSAIKMTFMLMGAALLLGLVATVPRFHANAVFFVVAYLGVIGDTLFPVWLFQGLEKMRYISIITGSFKAAAALCIFLFVHQPSDALIALTIQSLGGLIAGVTGITFCLIHFRIQLHLPRTAALAAVLRDGWHLFVSTAAVSLYTNTNVLLVGILAGNAEAGYFSAAQKLIRPIQGLIVPASQAIFPHVNLLVTQSRDKALRFARIALIWMGAPTLAASTLLFSLAGPLALLLFGASGTSTVPTIRWVAFLPFLIALSNVFGIQTMIPLGFDKQFSRILLLAGLINICVGVPLIHSFGAQGAGAAVLLAEMFVTGAMFGTLTKHGINVISAQKVLA